MKKFISLLLALTVVFGAMAQLPAVQLKDARGRAVDVSKLSNNGKPFAISMFATWCKPCLRELKAINEVYADWQDETGMKLFIVSIDKAQDAPKVKPLVDSEGWEYELLLDPNSDLYRALGVTAVPYVLVCDGNGNIVYNHTGYTDGGESQIIEAVRKAADAKPAKATAKAAKATSKTATKTKKAAKR